MTRRSKRRTRIRRIREELEALERAEKILKKETSPSKPKKNIKAARKRAKRAKKAARKRARLKAALSIPDAAEQVLRQNGKPLHAKEIAEKVQKLGVKATPHSVATSLQQYVYKGKRFKKTAPGTFGLR